VAQRLFASLSLGDIERGAHYALGLALRIAAAGAHGRQPVHAAVGVHHPVLLPILAPLAQRPLHGLADARSVIGMQGV
jgi:hypothetical protein